MTHQHPRRDPEGDPSNTRGRPRGLRHNPVEELLQVVRGDLEVGPHAAPELHAETPGAHDPTGGCPETLSVLIVGGRRTERDRLIARLAGRCAACRPAPTPEHARRALEEESFDVAIILAEAVERGGLTLLRDLAGGEGVIAPVLMGDRWTPAAQQAAHEAGAAAVLTNDCQGAELVDALRLAVRADRARRDAIALTAEELARQTDLLHRALDTLCDAMRESEAADLVAPAEGAPCDDPFDGPFDGPLDGEPGVTPDELEALWSPTPPPPWNPAAQAAAELDGRLRGELDIEVGLRRVLEFVLERLGPTNAAIFLPSSSGDYSLGAYVNYDRPKESAEVMLDHLAGLVAPEFERAEGIERIDDEAELTARFAGEAHWLHGSSLLAFACRQEDETLAVVTLFRDPLVGFSRQDLALCEDVQRVFTRRLAEIARVHHRALPDTDEPAGFDFGAFEPDEWTPDDELCDDESDWGMAA